MEVHSHTHSPRKKWTHYLWEFLMLFLAVFCGFLAENQREHMVEHKWERKYMISMVEDLQNDTIELARVIRITDSTITYSDSTLSILFNYKPTTTVPTVLSRVIGRGGGLISLVITDRTSSQLKNSGAMRLIRNKQVADGILRYWNQSDQTFIGIDRYMIYRNAGRSILFKLWVIPDLYNIVLHENKDSIRDVRVIDPDPKKWDEMMNLIGISRSICKNKILPDLKKQKELATDLIELIRDKYHLD